MGKKRYLKILGDFVYADDVISRSDLIKLKNRSYDVIIDLENWKQFDVNSNSWVELN